MKTLVAILQMLPAIISAVRSLEEAVPLSGKGKEKADLILGLASDLAGDANEMQGPISKAITRVVALFKATGVFGGSNAPTAG